MSGSRKGAKKAANVDRYGQRERGEADAEDASAMSVGEEEDEIEEVEPLLDGNEDHEAPPKEWTLADGSPVFRAGKKSLRIEPRLNRNAHGEDSSDIDGGARRRAREAEDGDYQVDAIAVIPVIENHIPPISATTPRGQTVRRNSPRQVQRHSPEGTNRAAPARQTAAVRAPATVVVATAPKDQISPLWILLLLLAALTGAAIMYSLFSNYHPAVILKGDNNHTTIINPLIAKAPAVVEAHRKIEALRDETNREITSVRSKLQEIDGRLVQIAVDLRREMAKLNEDTKSEITGAYTTKHVAMASKLQQERTALMKEMDDLKKSIADQLAKKLDVSDFEKRFKLDDLQSQLTLAINAITARVDILEKRPTVVSPIDMQPTPTPIPSAEIAILRTQLKDMQVTQESLLKTVDELQKSEKKLNDLIASQLSTPAYQSQIVNIINNYLASGSNKELNAAIKKLANDAMTHNNEFTTVLKDLATVSTRATSLENSINSLGKDLTQVKEAQGVLGKDIKDVRAQMSHHSGPIPVPIDLSGVHDRLQKLESQAIGGVDPTVRNELASLRILAEEARNEAANAKNEGVSADARRISDKESLESRLAEMEQRLASAPSAPIQTAPTNSPTSPAVTTEVIKNMIAEEVARKVSGATAISVGQPDHALYTTGARVLHKQTGFPSDLSWSSIEGAGWLSRLLLSHTSVSRNVPSVALDPNMTPGHCWPFPGDHGNFSVGLPCPITPTAFTVDHISAAESINPESMPRRFNVWGWQANDTAVERVKLISNAEYKSNGPTAQTFNVDKLALSGTRYNAFTLEITSNYADERASSFTCLYRFRVHGQRDNGCRKFHLSSATEPVDAHHHSA